MITIPELASYSDKICLPTNFIRAETNYIGHQLAHFLNIYWCTNKTYFKAGQKRA